MIRATRRGMLAGGLAASAVAGGLAGWYWRRGEGALLLHDPALEAGRRLASAHAGEALAIEGDRIRFARAVFARRPSLILGVSRPADALLIEDVGREAGYAPVREGVEPWREMAAGFRSRDRGAALGWILAPRA